MFLTLLCFFLEIKFTLFCNENMNFKMEDCVENLIFFFGKHMDKINWDYLCLNESIPLSFFEKHVNKINWVKLCLNKKIPVSFFEKYIFNLDEICWRNLCLNDKIPVSFFEKHLDKIDWSNLCKNKNIPVSFFEKHLDKINWSNLCKNKNIPFSFLEKHLDKIDPSDICLNENITDSFLEKISNNEIKNMPVHDDKNIASGFFWVSLCKNKKIPFSFFEKHLEEIRWYELCSNENVPVSFFEKHYKRIKCGRCFRNLCKNKNIPISFIEKYLVDYFGKIGILVKEEIIESLDLGCLFEKFIYFPLIEKEFEEFNSIYKKIISRYTGNKNLINDLYSKNVDMIWNVILKENVPVSFLEKHLENFNQFHWRTLCCNENIPVEFFEKHINKIYWEYLSLNSNIPISFFEKHLDKVDWEYLSCNDFGIIFLKEKRLRVLDEIKTLSSIPPGFNKVLTKGGIDYRDVINKYES